LATEDVHFPDLSVVAYLYKVVYFAVVTDLGAVQEGAVHTAVGSDFDAVADDDISNMGDLEGAEVGGVVGEAIRADHGTGMDAAILSKADFVVEHYTGKKHAVLSDLAVPPNDNAGVDDRACCHVAVPPDDCMWSHSHVGPKTAFDDCSGVNPFEVPFLKGFFHDSDEGGFRVTHHDAGASLNRLCAEEAGRIATSFFFRVSELFRTRSVEAIDCKDLDWLTEVAAAHKICNL